MEGAVTRAAAAGGHGDLLAEVSVVLPLPPDPELKRWAEMAQDGKADG